MEEQLGKLECPFTWDVPEYENRADILNDLNRRDDQSDFIVNGFCVSILECFERARGDEIQLAIRKAEECEIVLNEYSPKCGVFSKSDKYIWERSRDALWHVLLATQAHLGFKNNDLQYAEEKIAKSVDVQCKDDSSLAALQAIKSKFFQGYGGGRIFTERAINCARQAVQLDDTVPLWHFLLGKSLARHRRQQSPYASPSSEEQLELEKAWQEYRKPDIGVMLLQTYQSFVGKIKGSEYESLKQTILATIEGIKMYAMDEWYVYWRCAHVCVRLPRGIVPPEEVENIIDCAFKFSEQNRNMNKKHLLEVRASYYKFILRDYERALEFYEKAADEGETTCIFDVLSLNNRNNPDKDLIPVIDKYVDQYRSYRDTHSKLLVIKANYLMFVKQEIEEAFKIYLEIMREDCSSYQLLNCRPLFGEAPKNYSVYKNLKQKLKEAIRWSHPDDSATYKNYLQIVSDYEKLACNK